MKKISLILAAILALTFVFASCGDDGDEKIVFVPVAVEPNNPDAPDNPDNPDSLDGGDETVKENIAIADSVEVQREKVDALLTEDSVISELFSAGNISQSEYQELLLGNYKVSDVMDSHEIAEKWDSEFATIDEEIGTVVVSVDCLNFVVEMSFSDDTLARIDDAYGTVTPSVLSNFISGEMDDFYDEVVEKYRGVATIHGIIKNMDGDEIVSVDFLCV